MKILLVEPDRSLGATYQSVLRKAGHTISWRRDGQAAIDALDEQMPDLILLEIQLGTHNGIELLYEMRSYAEWREIPVIIHTMNANARDLAFQTAFKQLGVQAILYKPEATNKDLVRVIKNVFEYSS